MIMGRILVVEDDRSLADLVETSLTTVGLVVSRARTLAQARFALQEGDMDLALIDLTLPDGDGLVLLDALRTRLVPAIIISARDAVKDKVRGLERGAEDYITKPFDPLELIARVRAALRRTNRSPRSLKVRDLEIDAEARTVVKDREPVNLARREFDLLLCLVEHKGIALTRERLLALAFGYEFPGDSRTVDVHVQRLRRKLGADLIMTVPGIGYRVEA
jgi:two-component system alkaline phosphatase synthesis response regulator PhoP